MEWRGECGIAPNRFPRRDLAPEAVNFGDGRCTRLARGKERAGSRKNDLKARQEPWKRTWTSKIAVGSQKLHWIYRIIKIYYYFM